MSTATEVPPSGEQHQQQQQQNLEHNLKELKLDQARATTNSSEQNATSQQHPLHQYDLSIMTRFYESCISKMSEQNQKWKASEWANAQPMPGHLSWEEKYNWPNPFLYGEKQRVCELFTRLARESGEPMVLLPNFDFGDIMNFEKFLESLKLDGVNAIGKYKQYLNNREMKKNEIDLVVMHARYGIMLVEVRESDNFDNKKRSRARMQLKSAQSTLEAVLRLILEAKGLKPSECHLPIMQFVALPNVRELPAQHTQANSNDTQNTSTGSIGSTNSGRSSKALHYLSRADLENQHEFGKWWHRAIVEPRQNEEQQKQQTNGEQNGEEGKEKQLKKDELINLLIGLTGCIRNNSILPVVYPETGAESGEIYGEHKDEKAKNNEQTNGEEQNGAQTSEDKQHHFQPALNVYAEFFRPQHEEARSLSKVVVISRDLEKIRKTICLQTLWLLLNDSSKKISVVCSEMNKPYYEEFFARQRKVYNNLNNLRFYTDIHSCDPSQHTLKRDGETWFFDSGLNASLNDVLSRVKDLNSFWIFTDQQEKVNELQNELNQLGSRYCNLDEEKQGEQHNLYNGLMGSSRIKLPLRLKCDLLVVGDLIGVNQLKYLYRYLKNTSVVNQAGAYQQGNQNQHYQNQHYQQHYQQLKFNPSKKFRTIKFIRGGTIDNLRNALKMHDSVSAPVIFIHVGDEDLFKTRYSQPTIERIKELATLVKEYCPKSFVVLSTIMRRLSRTENSQSNEVNKGIIEFCRQTRDSLNCHYMINNHFEPEYHTQGRLLNNKGLKLFADNMLFVVDHFLIRNNKQP